MKIVLVYLINLFIYFGVKTTYDNYNRPTSYINSCDNGDTLEPYNNYSRPVKGMYGNDTLEPYNNYSRPVKGMYANDSLDSLHIPHVIFDKELNCYAISLAGNKPEDIANYDELVEQMNILEYNRYIFKDCTIEDVKLVGAHCTGNIHQEAEAIRYNLYHKDNPYDEGYDAGYDAGYETAKRELEDK